MIGAMLKHRSLSLIVLLALVASVLAACLASRSPSTGSGSPAQQKTAQPTPVHPLPAVTNTSPITRVPVGISTPFSSLSPDLSPTSPLPQAPTFVPNVAASASPTPSSQALDAPAPLPKTQYNLTAELNYDQHHLAVTEQITYTNHANEALNDLVLMVDSMNYGDCCATLGAFKLNRLTWADGQPVENYNTETRCCVRSLTNVAISGSLRLPLRQPLPPGASLGLSLAYELSLPSPTPDPQTRPVPFGYTAKQTNLVDWYPFVAPYVTGKGWLAHPAGYFGEHLVYDIADFQVNVRLVGGRQGLTVAASAPAVIDGDWRRYQFNSARNFVWSVSHDYQVASETVGDVTVLSYFFPIHPTAGQAALKTTAQALALYSELYGPYRHATLTVVEADFLDGMEYDGLYFLSNGFYNLYQGQPGDYLVSIAAHETAHQWWYGLVGDDQAMEPWLDEALATYSERLFYERVYPEGLDWWWNYRVDYYQPRGWVDSNIYNSGSWRAYRDAVYLNGAYFLEDLRKQIGDAAFFAFLKDYAAQYAGRIAAGDDFFNLLKQHTQTDITPLLKKYFSSR